MRIRSEAGITLIQVAIAIFVLTGFSAFVLDHGVMMLARGQLQRAADATALAGALGWLQDEPLALTPTAITTDAMDYTVSANRSFAGGATGKQYSYVCPPGVTGIKCVRVEVYRDGSHESDPLPTYFGKLFGLNTQSSRATATAAAQNANATNCLKPWLIPDRWEENTGPVETYNGPPIAGSDVYTPPDEDGSGTGWSTAQIGTVLVLKEGDPHSSIDPGQYYEIGDASTYKDAITGCIISKGIGDTVSTLPGNRKGPTKDAVRDLLTANGGPVVVPVAMFSPAEYAGLDHSTGNFDLTIVNMMGFRIDDVDNNGTITGTIVSGTGIITAGGSTVGGGASLLKQVVLVK